MIEIQQSSMKRYSLITEIEYQGTELVHSQSDWRTCNQSIQDLIPSLVII